MLSHQEAAVVCHVYIELYARVAGPWEFDDQRTSRTTGIIPSVMSIGGCGPLRVEECALRWLVIEHLADGLSGEAHPGPCAIEAPRLCRVTG